MSKDLSAYQVRMFPVEATDWSEMKVEGDKRLITGGKAVFSRSYVNRLEEVGHTEIAELNWQNGVIDPATGANGVTCEAVIQAVIGRLTAYQDSSFSCRENALAITALEEALGRLLLRRQDRFKRDVLNTHEV